jgi:ATP-dependent Lon protease
VLDGLADLGPREMRRALMTAFGNAKLAARDEIQLGDLSENRAAKKQRIGF